MKARDLLKGALMLGVGVVVTWSIASAFEDHAITHSTRTDENLLPDVAAATPAVKRRTF